MIEQRKRKRAPTPDPIAQSTITDPPRPKNGSGSKRRKLPWSEKECTRCKNSRPTEEFPSKSARICNKCRNAVHSERQRSRDEASRASETALENVCIQLPFNCRSLPQHLTTHRQRASSPRIPPPNRPHFLKLLRPPPHCGSLDARRQGPQGYGKMRRLISSSPDDEKLSMRSVRPTANGA